MKHRQFAFPHIGINSIVLVHGTIRMEKIKKQSDKKNAAQYQSPTSSFIPKLLLTFS